MKPKELFSRLVKRDGYVMYNNQGIIAFDKKGNFISSDSINAEIIPATLLSDFGVVDNPALSSSYIFTFIVCKKSTDNYSIEINYESPYTTYIEFYPQIIDDAFLENLEDEELKNYFLSKIGWYFGELACVLTDKETGNLLELQVGDKYTIKITVDGVVVFNDEREVLNYD